MQGLFLHGYGAGGADLEPLLSELGLAGMAPDAPHVMPQGGRSWYDLDWQADGMKWDQDQVRDVIRDLAPDIRSGVVLGGFSQGASLVYGALCMEFRPSAAIILSGYDPHVGSLPLLSGFPVFIAHGRQDAVVPFEEGRKLADKLRDHDANVTTCWTNEGHTISYSTLAQLGLWARHIRETLDNAFPL